MGKLDLDRRRGPIESSWRCDGGRVHYRFTIPDGTAATLALPGAPTRTLPPGTHHLTL